MNILLRIMGFVAGMNHSLSRQSVNFVPMNWGLIGVCGVVGAVMLQIAVRDGDPSGYAIAFPALLVGLAFLISTLKRDTFFRRENGSENGSGAPVAPASETAIFEAPLGFTGKLRLHEKEARRFLNIPARAMRLESGALAFVSNIDASTRFSGVVTQSKVGLWISVPRLESTSDAPPIECGTLFYGKKPRPALRVHFNESADAKNARVKAILSFDISPDRDAMRDFLSSQTQHGAMLANASPFSNGPIR